MKVVGDLLLENLRVVKGHRKKFLVDMDNQGIFVTGVCWLNCCTEKYDKKGLGLFGARLDCFN